jgi:hypothetical protein
MMKRLMALGLLLSVGSLDATKTVTVHNDSGGSINVNYKYRRNKVKFAGQRQFPQHKTLSFEHGENRAVKAIAFDSVTIDDGKNPLVKVTGFDKHPHEHVTIKSSDACEDLSPAGFHNKYKLFVKKLEAETENLKRKLVRGARHFKAGSEENEQAAQDKKAAAHERREDKKHQGKKKRPRHNQYHGSKHHHTQD